MASKKKRSKLQQLINRIDAERRRLIRSWYVSIGANVTLLILLALWQLPVPQQDNFELVFTLSPAEVDEPEPEPQVVELPGEEVLPEPIEEPQQMEPEVEEAPQETPPPEPIEEASEPAKLVENAEDTGEADQPSSPTNNITTLVSDEQRLRETTRRVQDAGGNIKAPVRISLSFEGDDDLDLHVRFSGEHHQRGYDAAVNGYLWYRQPRSLWGALDVDANAQSIMSLPCENVAFTMPPQQSTYVVDVHHYLTRGRPEPTPYVVVVKYGRRSQVYHGVIRPGELLRICEFTYRHPKRYNLREFGPKRSPQGGFLLSNRWG